MFIKLLSNSPCFPSNTRCCVYNYKAEPFFTLGQILTSTKVSLPAMATLQQRPAQPNTWLCNSINKQTHSSIHREVYLPQFSNVCPCTVYTNAYHQTQVAVALVYPNTNPNIKKLLCFVFLSFCSCCQ